MDTLPIGPVCSGPVHRVPFLFLAYALSWGKRTTGINGRKAQDDLSHVRPCLHIDGQHPVYEFHKAVAIRVVVGDLILAAKDGEVGSFLEAVLEESH